MMIRFTRDWVLRRASLIESSPETPNTKAKSGMQRRGAWIAALLTVASLGSCVRSSVEEPQNDSDFLSTGRTLSHFTAIQVDPRSEDSAGPQFAVAEDLNDDGLVDIVSAWNQSQPVQVHLQRRTDRGGVRFETLTLAGNIPVVSVAGLVVADFDGDFRPDIAVLVKDSALPDAGCIEGTTSENATSGLIITYFGPGDPARANQALAWEEEQIGTSLLQGTRSETALPEDGGYTAMAAGDIDLDGTMDIVAILNSACEGAQSDVLVFQNQGFGPARDGTWVRSPIPDGFLRGTIVRDVALADIDRDGDLDIVVTRPDARAMNVRWYRNPARDIPDDFHISNGDWQVGVVAQIASGADVIDAADVDGDQIVDIIVRSTSGAVIQWLKGPESPTSAPLRAIPWQVYTLAEFRERVPEAIAIGDLNFDGQVEVVAAAGGGLVIFNAATAPSVYDQWRENLIVDDLPPGRPTNAPATTDPNVAPEEIAGTTFINSVLIVDLDGDGANDVLGTLDRSGLSGLSNDALAWFRNTRQAPR